MYMRQTDKASCVHRPSCDSYDGAVVQAECSAAASSEQDEETI